MTSTCGPPEYGEIVGSLDVDKVADSVTQLFGNMNTHIQNLEDLEKNIDEESQACLRPSIASKFNNLRSLVHDVLRKVRSYKSCCQDIAKFGNGCEEEESQALDEMLSFVQRMHSFSPSLNKRVDAIITETEKVVNAVRKQKASIPSSRPPHDRAQRSPDQAQMPFHKAAPTCAQAKTPPTPSPPKGQMAPDNAKAAPSCTQVGMLSDSVMSPDKATHSGAAPTLAQAQMPVNSEQAQALPQAQPGHGSTSGMWLRNFFRGYTGERSSTDSERESLLKMILEKCEKKLGDLSVEAQRLKKDAIRNFAESTASSPIGQSEVAEVYDGIRKIKDSCRQFGSLLNCTA